MVRPTYAKTNWHENAKASCITAWRSLTKLIGWTSAYLFSAYSVWREQPGRLWFAIANFMWTKPNALSSSAPFPHPYLPQICDIVSPKNCFFFDNLHASSLCISRCLSSANSCSVHETTAALAGVNNLNFINVQLNIYTLLHPCQINRKLYLDKWEHLCLTISTPIIH